MLKVQFSSTFNNVNIKKMYGRHYGYKTSVSKMMISHLKEKVERLKKVK